MFLQNDAYATTHSSMSLEKHSEWATVIHPVTLNPVPNWSLPSWSPGQTRCM